MENFKYEIKIPTTTDAIELDKIDRECFNEDVRMDATEWAAVFDSQCRVFYVLNESNKVVGAAVIKMTTFGLAYLYSTAVLPNYRKQGVGESLLLHRLNFLRSQGFRRVQAHTRVDNEIGGGLLEKFGFIPTEYVPDFYGDFQDGILWQIWI